MDAPINPALLKLTEYFTDSAAAVRNRAPDADWIDLSIGDPNEPTPEVVRQALLSAVDPVMHYPTSLGLAQLRASVADWAARRHGVTADPASQILPAAGSKEAIFHLPMAVLDPAGRRRHVVWGDPGYPIYERGTVLAGGISDAVTLRPENGWRLELADLPQEQLDRCCIAWVSYPHNPTGATVDLDYFRRQVTTARENGIILASDECYQEIWFDTPAPSVLEACDGDFSGVLAFVSLSKRSGMTGYRSGAIIGDQALIATLRRLRVNIGTASPSFIQRAAIAAWDDQAHVDERRKIFAAKRDVLLPFLESIGLDVASSDGTFYLWFRVPGGDDVAYAEALHAAHILITPGRAFGPAGVGWARIALVPTVDECARVAERWGAAHSDGLLPV